MLDHVETKKSSVVRTVLGSVPAHELGIVLIHESLLSVVPGAEYAPEINMDKSEIFDILKRKLTDFRRAGGKTIVDRTGMFHGRDVKLYETLSKTTGVHIIASTGLGPEPMLSGYFTTPQTHPPTPWPAEQFAGLFQKEITEGIAVPRIERSGFAGIVTSIATQSGIAEIEKSLFRGSAIAALKTGVAVSVQYGADATGDLEIIVAEGISPDRVIIGGLDRQEAVRRKEAFAVAERGANVALDHVGWSTNDGYVNDEDRVQLIVELFEAGLGERVLISTNAVGVAKGHEAKDLEFDYLLTKFVPLLRKAGLTDEQLRTLLAENPQRVLTVDDEAELKMKGWNYNWNDLFSPVAR
ncbi:phosphotriesterase [Bacillus sp. B15-48]|uniref:phosphotriesterase family protein n=1 Tax=Bacillus sp. B15-48 TaxID=1548601 RepID=UPI00193F3F8C|nr:phosphotriesterase [Bacillus sp. B15-48]MBM4764903.1 phosphotriesterase [Bacillus sp. B15-48]